MIFNYGKLSGIITQKFGSRLEFSKSLGISNATLSRKMHGKLNFTQDEIAKSCDLLAIDYSEIPDYFFATNSQQY